MNLFTNLTPITDAGMEITIKVKKVPEGLQVDLLPQGGKDNKIGVALPARALVATAAELDGGFEQFLATYAQSVFTVNSQIEQANAELKAIEDAAAAARKDTVTAKTTTSKTSGGKSGGKPKAAPTLLGGSDDSDADDDEGSDGAQAGGQNATATETTTDASPTVTETVTTTAPAGAGTAMAELF